MQEARITARIHDKAVWTKFKQLARLDSRSANSLLNIVLETFVAQKEHLLPPPAPPVSEAPSADPEFL